MTARTIEKFSQKALVVGPIYDRIEILDNNQEIWEQYPLIIFNGNICYPNDNLDEVKKRIDLMEDFIQTQKGQVIYNLGNLDLLLIKHLDASREHHDLLQWLQSKGNVVFVKFLNQPELIVTSGGVTPNMGRADLQDNLETSFVSKVKDAPWHRWYGGGYGYIVSNNPLTFEEPQFWNFSLQLGQIYCEKTQVYAVNAGSPAVDRIFSL